MAVLSTAAIDAAAKLAADDEGIVGYSEDEFESSTGQRGIRIFVVDDAAAERMPTEIGGVPVVEVRVVGHTENKAEQAGTVAVTEVDPKTRVRPVIGGISISGPGSGTLGYFVKIKGELYLVSAAHVLKTMGEDVIQPSSVDGGTAADKIGVVSTRVLDPDKGVDAAAAKLSAPGKLDLNGLGKVVGTGTVAKGDTVKKSGKNSRVTEGTVIDVDFTWTNAPEGPFKHQIVVENASGFSVKGDSGSLVVTPGLAAVGLLKGGGVTIDYVNPIDRVLAELGNATIAT